MSTDVPLDGREGDEPEVTTPTEKPVVPPKKEATKLLDELFRKTKTPPSIYWLPLTEAEVREEGGGSIVVCVWWFEWSS